MNCTTDHNNIFWEKKTKKNKNSATGAMGEFMLHRHHIDKSQYSVSACKRKVKLSLCQSSPHYQSCTANCCKCTLPSPINRTNQILGTILFFFLQARFDDLLGLDFRFSRLLTVLNGILLRHIERKLHVSLLYESF